MADPFPARTSEDIAKSLPGERVENVMVKTKPKPRLRPKYASELPVDSRFFKDAPTTVTSIVRVRPRFSNPTVMMEPSGSTSLAAEGSGTQVQSEYTTTVSYQFVAQVVASARCPQEQANNSMLPTNNRCEQVVRFAWLAIRRTTSFIVGLAMTVTKTADRILDILAAKHMMVAVRLAVFFV